MPKVVIFGIGDAASLAHSYFSHDTDHDVVAFTVDAKYASAPRFLDLPVVEFEKVSKLYPPSEYEMFIAVGYSHMNQVRAAKFFQAKDMGYNLVTYISSRCAFLSEIAVGQNCFILENTIIQPFVHIGNNVTVWSGSHIGHHSVVEDHCFFAPRTAIAGRVHIGQYSFIGINATVRNGLTIGSSSLLGAGSIIMEDTASNSVYIPNRTKPSGKRSLDIEL
jgi:sugar O-acyltransferase (sialic acid O-acetyltransferase NeuD family)